MFFYNGFTIKAFFPRNKSELFRVLVSNNTKTTASLGKRDSTFTII